MKKIKLIAVGLLIILMAYLPIFAEEIQANLRKTGSFEDYAIFEGGSIYINEYVDWSVTYNAGSGEIASCQASVSIVPESIIINWEDNQWQFSNITTSTLTPVISNGKGACTLGYSYSFTAKRFEGDQWVTKSISNTKRFDVTSEGLTK